MSNGFATAAPHIFRALRGVYLQVVKLFDRYVHSSLFRSHGYICQWYTPREACVTYIPSFLKQQEWLGYIANMTCRYLSASQSEAKAAISS